MHWTRYQIEIIIFYIPILSDAGVIIAMLLGCQRIMSPLRSFYFIIIVRIRHNIHIYYLTSLRLFLHRYI